MHKYFWPQISFLRSWFWQQPTYRFTHDKKHWWFWVSRFKMTWEVAWFFWVLILLGFITACMILCVDFNCWLNKISNLRFGRPDGRYRVDPVLHKNIRPIQFQSGSNAPQFLSSRDPQSPLDSCLCPRRSSRRTPSRRRWSRWCPCRDANVHTHDCQSWERRPPKNSKKKLGFIFHKPYWPILLLKSEGKKRDTFKNWPLTEKPHFLSYPHKNLWK